MLSEKAKGKQRAVDPEPAENIRNARQLMIRFTEGFPDLVLTITQDQTILSVKRQIWDTRPQLKDRRLRLIHAGRLLTDGTLLYSWLSSLEEKQQRAVSAQGHATPSATNPMAWLHCSVGPKIDPGAETEETVQTAQLKPLRGFDRLAAAGFSETDIANFRRQFHGQSSVNYLDIDYGNEDEYDEHARALEEQWIDSIDTAGSIALSSSSSSQNIILQGMLVGFFFPILPLFFLRDSKPATFWEDGREQESTESVVFSRKMQMGIVVGFVVNLIFGLWRYILYTS